MIQDCQQNILRNKVPNKGSQTISENYKLRPEDIIIEFLM